MKKLVSLILIGLLVGGMTSCATNDSQQIAPDISTSTLSSSITPTSAASSSISTLNDTQSPKNPFIAYNDVLQNKTEFITTSYAENGTKTIYLNQLLNDGLDTFKFLNFAVLDMDGDEIPEVVIQYCLTVDYPYPDYVEVALQQRLSLWL